MRTYKVAESVSGETNDPMFGAVAFKFSGGKHRPKSDHEEVALDWLVRSGLAEVVGDDAEQSSPGAPAEKPKPKPRPRATPKPKATTLNEQRRLENLPPIDHPKPKTTKPAAETKPETTETP